MVLPFFAVAGFYVDSLLAKVDVSSKFVKDYKIVREEKINNYKNDKHFLYVDNDKNSDVKNFLKDSLFENPDNVLLADNYGMKFSGLEDTLNGASSFSVFVPNNFIKLIKTDNPTVSLKVNYSGKDYFLLKGVSYKNFDESDLPNGKIVMFSLDQFNKDTLSKLVSSYEEDLKTDSSDNDFSLDLIVKDGVDQYLVEKIIKTNKEVSESKNVESSNSKENLNDAVEFLEKKDSVNIDETVNDVGDSYNISDNSSDINSNKDIDSSVNSNVSKPESKRSKKYSDRNILKPTFAVGLQYDPSLKISSNNVLSLADVKGSILYSPTFNLKKFGVGFLSDSEFSYEAGSSYLDNIEKSTFKSVSLFSKFMGKAVKKLDDLEIDFLLGMNYFYSRTSSSDVNATSDIGIEMSKLNPSLGLSVYGKNFGFNFNSDFYVNFLSSMSNLSITGDYDLSSDFKEFNNSFGFEFLIRNLLLNNKVSLKYINFSSDLVEDKVLISESLSASYRLSENFFLELSSKLDFDVNGIDGKLNPQLKSGLGIIFNK